MMMKPAAAAINAVLLNCGRVSSCSAGSTAHTLLLPSTSRYTPNIERGPSSSDFLALSAAESSRRDLRISAADVVCASDVDAGSSCSDCCGSSASDVCSEPAFLSCSALVIRSGKTAGRRRAIVKAVVEVRNDECAGTPRGGNSGVATENAIIFDEEAILRWKRGTKALRDGERIGESERLDGVHGGIANVG